METINLKQTSNCFCHRNLDEQFLELVYLPFSPIGGNQKLTWFYLRLMGREYNEYKSHCFFIKKAQQRSLYQVPLTRSAKTLFSLKEETSGSLLINSHQGPWCYIRNENVAEVKVNICDHAFPSHLLIPIKKVSWATQCKWDEKEAICQNTKLKKKIIFMNLKKTLRF